MPVSLELLLAPGEAKKLTTEKLLVSGVKLSRGSH